jgi:hypothetical protein
MYSLGVNSEFMAKMSAKEHAIQQATVRAMAFHLPQFHPIPENDKWRGKGFTERANVAKATPRVPSHYQPNLPADLSFCDLQLPMTDLPEVDMQAREGSCEPLFSTFLNATPFSTKSGKGAHPNEPTPRRYAIVSRPNQKMVGDD